MKRAGARGTTRAFGVQRACGLVASGRAAHGRGARVRGACGRGAAVLLAGGAILLAGCSSGGPKAVASGAAGSAGPSGSGATCGTTRTAADVPVIIKVAKGTVSCATALRVEDEYAAKIRDGQVAGNGGGAPVTISGWTCQGYNTPDLLKTGDASQCHTGTATILAVLPVPTPTAG